jgi:Zn-dependent peptidase ImmA (M78 family)
MKPYAELHIFGQVWLVYKKPFPTDEFAGHCLFDTHTIEINAAIPEKTMDFTETLMHEFLHALFRRLSYYQHIPPALEEIMNDQISRAIAENFTLTPVRLHKAKK